MLPLTASYAGKGSAVGSTAGGHLLARNHTPCALVEPPTAHMLAADSEVACQIGGRSIGETRRDGARVGQWLFTTPRRGILRLWRRQCGRKSPRAVRLWAPRG